MASRKKQVEPASVPREVVYAGNPPLENPLFYVNQVEIVVGNFDFQVRMNRLVGTRPDGNIDRVNYGTMAMSPQHAKSFAQLLARSVSEFEAKHGILPDAETNTAEDS